MEEIKQEFSKFEEGLLKKVNATFSSSDSIEFFNSLAAQSQRIVAQINTLGQLTFDALADNQDKYSDDKLWLQVANYRWLPQMKSYALLWRDMVFQTHKALIRLWTKELSTVAFEDFKKKSEEQLTLATNQVTNFIPKQLLSLNAKDNNATVVSTQWDLEENPQPIYKNQIEQIGQQCLALSNVTDRLKQHFVSFQSINDLICNSLTNYQKIIKSEQQIANDTMLFVNDNIRSKAGKIAIHAKNIEGEIEYSNHQDAFKLSFETLLLTISEKLNLPIDTKDGVILTKDVAFRRKVKQWIESEISPLMYEIWELLEFTTDTLKRSLRNVQNRTTIIANDIKNEKSVNIEDVDAPLKNFLKRTNNWQKEIQRLDDLIRQRLEQSFLLSKVYEPKNDFLPVPLQSTLTQSWFAETKLYQRFSVFYNFINTKIQQFKTTVEQETNLSTSEKIVRYVQTHQITNSNHHYTSIFLTKGYIGEAFWVERKFEMQHIQELIGQWKLGYRGSVLLHGQRFSGKTLFGEMVANRHFPNNVVRLSPKTIVHFNGRKHQTTFDLGDALQFVKKYNTKNLRPMIWIDDLETWADADNLITENIRKLTKFIDSQSNSIFVMVSVSNWAKAHLNSIYDINKVFQADFNLDKMNIDEIHRAILIRHGATHRTLVDNNHEEVKRSQLIKMVQKVSRAGNGNIGETLNLWALSIQLLDEENVQFHYPQIYSMPDFINPDIGIVLSSIMMEKRTNEYRLRKLFGKAFEEKYKNIVQRLISVGLLVRHIDNNLEINELVVNEVGRLLEQEKYIAFSN
ncbi:MAG: hypothetical protein AB8G11_19155 [Saprospiraceae bacterium]